MSFSDADFQKTMNASVRLGLIFAAIGTLVLLPTRGWQSAAMFIVGALISTTGVWEWRRLMTAVSLQMDRADAQQKIEDAQHASVASQNNLTNNAADKKANDVATKSELSHSDNELGHSGTNRGSEAGFSPLSLQRDKGALAPAHAEQTLNEEGHSGRDGLQPVHSAGQEEGALAPEELLAPKPRMGFVLAVFFLRLGLTVVVLYVTLKYLQGSVFALAAGLLVGILALLIQAFRLLRSWTV